MDVVVAVDGVQSNAASETIQQAISRAESIGVLAARCGGPVPNPSRNSLI
jgi:hypothetical protein